MNLIESIINNKEKTIKIEGLTGASKWLFIERIQDISKKSILVITEQNSIENVFDDIRFFLNRISVKKDCRACVYPAWEILPFEPLSPHPDIAGERLHVLNRLRKGELLIIVSTIEAIIQNVMPWKMLERTSLRFEKDDILERELITEYLVKGGYQHTDIVDHKGEFSIRGDIIDIFPSSSLNPVRIEFFGDEIESIKEFDINTQRSVKIIESVDILPAREIVLTEELLKTGIDNLKKYAKIINRDVGTVIECFSQSINFSGMERFAPFFYEMDTFFDYLPDDALIAFDEPDALAKAYDDFSAAISDEYKRSIDRDDVYPGPDMFYLDHDNLNACFDRYQNMELSALKLSDQGIKVETKSVNIFQYQFNTFIENTKKWLAQGCNLFIVVQTDGQAQRLNEILTEKEIGAEILSRGSGIDISPFGLSISSSPRGLSENLHPDSRLLTPKRGIIYILIGNLSSGFYLLSSDTIFITENEIYGQQKKIRVRKAVRKDKLLAEVDHIKPGDFVVHIEYGVGKYLGTKFINIHNREEELLDIEYSDGEKLYLPMEGISCLQKYRAVGDSIPQLARLGSSSWKKSKEKAKKAVQEIAEDLLKLYASRGISSGFSFASDNNWHREFAESFEYDETEDQLRAINDIMKDMESPRPMDRLICGDVGFGKTEVAMRAAFKTVFDKKQVAVLVPTTLLAHQHYQTFKQRFRSFPVNIDVLSRFKSAKKQQETIQMIREGKVDIIIGTHRIIQKDITFKDLGLIVIDEEQRFGVTHKEKLKKLRTSVDVMALTATPIPRTLHLSLAGIRDMSIIATPPHDRQAIRTYIRKFSDNIIHEAVLREMERKGQIFFVHNRVESIDVIAEHIKRLIPHARVGVAHGQMHERQLEKVMLDFIDKRLDILVCTTIIESGLDIPAANTIIINRADKFGLAQLYQLRGRVGRDRHRAYAYLLVPGEILISKSARARLEAMEELSDLGAGLQLATRDLEIRGSGSVLSHKQSGHIASVGFYMYCKLLEDTIKELKGQPVEEQIDIVVKIGIKGFIPKNFISDVSHRLEMYKRIYMVDDLDSLSDISDEITDRYGPIPEPLQDLIYIIQLKVLAKKLKIERIEIGKDGTAAMTFDSKTPLDGEKILEFMKRYKNMKFTSSNVIKISFNREDIGGKIDMIKGVLKEFLKL